MDLEANVSSYGTLRESSSSSTSASRRVLRGFLLGLIATAMVAVTCAVALVIYNGDRPLPFVSLDQIYNPLTGQTEHVVRSPRDIVPSKVKLDTPKSAQQLSLHKDRWFNPITGEINERRPKHKQPKYGKALYGYAADIPTFNRDFGDDNSKTKKKTAKQFWDELGLGDRYVYNPNYNPKYNPGGADAEAGGVNFHHAKSAQGKASGSSSSSSAVGKPAVAAAAAAAPAAGKPVVAAAAAGKPVVAAAAAPAPAKFAVDKPQLASNKEFEIAEKDEAAAEKAEAEAEAVQRALAVKPLAQQPKAIYAPPPAQPKAIYAPPPQQQQQMYQQPAQKVQYAAPMQQYINQPPQPQQLSDGPEMQPPIAPEYNPSLAEEPSPMMNQYPQNVETVQEADSEYSPGYEQQAQ